MSAAVTEKLKKHLVQALYDDVGDSASHYYIAIGRSETWNDSDVTPTQTGSLFEDLNFRLSLQSVKQAANYSFCVPRVNWVNGTVYDAYGTSTASYTTNYHYVITASNSVYICLRQGRNASGTAVPSTVEPTGSSTTSFTTADGYTWKFLYTINAGDASKYLSANFMPVKLQAATDSDSPATDIEQETIQNAAVVGQLGSIRVADGGAGYASAPTVTIAGDGTGAAATATISGGRVVKVELDSDGSGNTSHGQDYSKAVIEFSGGSPTTAATAYPVLAPELGFGADPRDDLKSTGIMFNTKPEGSESDDFIIGNDFRQIALMKNITFDDSDSLYDASTGMALNYLDFNTITSAFTPDRTIEGGTSGAKAIVDRHDTSNDRVYFHQTSVTGFDAFTDGESITEISGSGSGTLAASNSTVPGDINPMSGSILYIENRAAIDRAADQTEDIKLVIKF